MALVNMNFESRYLGNNNTVSIILPDMPRTDDPAAFYGSGQKYKVLWLLHGTYGDHTDWQRKSMIELYARERDLAVVMFSGMNANYVNWPDFGTGYYLFDYLFEELMPMVYNWYPISDRREDNFIAGLSMGGYGAMIYAAARPEKFAVAASLSAPTWNPHLIGESADDLINTDRMEKALRNQGGKEAFLASVENVWDRLDALKDTGRLPKLYYCCGTDDFLYPAYQVFKKHAAEIGLDATFEEEAGYGHEWRFWDRYIQRVIDFCGVGERGAGNPY